MKASPAHRVAGQPTRRAFLQAITAGLGMPMLAAQERRLPTINQDKTLLTTRHASEGAPAPEGDLATGSDVGSLFPFIQSQATTDPSLSFLRDRYRDLGSWKKLARGKLLELLQYSPRPCDPRAEVVDVNQEDGYRREKVCFNTTPDVRVPAYVLIPNGLTKPAPGIVALHDHGGFYLWGKEKLVQSPQEHPSLTEFRKQSYAGKSIASELARRGYVVLVIDMFYWGERRLLLDDDASDWRNPDLHMARERVAAFNRRAGENEQLVGRTIFAAGFTWAGVMFWDDVRSVEYLVSRPEVDKNRIGCVGLSVGGLRSCHLAALDDRIKAAVVVGWMCSFPRQLQKHIRHTIGHTKLVPGLYRYLDYPDVASLAMPSSLLVINGRKDTLFEPSGVQLAFDKLAACYRKAGIGDRFRARLYDTPHEFNEEMQTEAWEWLKRWI
jgi:dienelactone hydrolase